MEELSAPTFAPRMGADRDAVGVAAIKGWKLQLCLGDAGAACSIRHKLSNEP